MYIKFNNGKNGRYIMKENEIYDPPGFSLPALKIKKRKSRKNIENDSTVNNLIESKLLLNREFNSLYLNIFNKSNKIYNLFDNPIRLWYI